MTGVMDREDGERRVVSRGLRRPVGQGVTSSPSPSDHRDYHRPHLTHPRRLPLRLNRVIDRLGSRDEGAFRSGRGDSGEEVPPEGLRVGVYVENDDGVGGHSLRSPLVSCPSRSQSLTLTSLPKPLCTYRARVSRCRSD